MNRKPPRTMPRIGPANNAHHWKDWQKRHHAPRPIDLLRAIQARQAQVQQDPEKIEEVTCKDCKRITKKAGFPKPCLKHFVAAGYPAERYESYFAKRSEKTEEKDIEDVISSLNIETIPDDNNG